MNKHIKRLLITSFVLIFIIIAIISTYFITKYFTDKAIINKVTEIYSDDNVQDRLNNEENELLLQIDGETVLGVIEIEKIGFEGLVYEGTSLSTLAKGVGHFENSPYLDGNVCLAAHNTNKFWAKLHTLHSGDKITYHSFLGTKVYYVVSVNEISEDDWSSLENTNDNFLTLITCVKGKRNQRLCVQALEFN